MRPEHYRKKDTPEVLKEKIDKKVKLSSKREIMEDVVSKISASPLKLLNERAVAYLERLVEDGKKALTLNEKKSLVDKYSTTMRNYIGWSSRKEALEWRQYFKDKNLMKFVEKVEGEKKKKYGNEGEAMKAILLQAILTDAGITAGQLFYDITKTGIKPGSNKEYKERIERQLEYRDLDKIKNDLPEYVERRRNALQFTRNDNGKILEEAFRNRPDVDVSKITMMPRVWKGTGKKDENGEEIVEYSDSKDVRKNFDTALGNGGEIWVNLYDKNGNFLNKMAKIRDGQVIQVLSAAEEYWQ